MMAKEKNKQLFVVTLFLALFTYSAPAFAGPIDTIVANLTTSFEDVPKVIAVISYLCGISFGIAALFKLVRHADLPNQEPMKGVVIRLVIGGMFLALPSVVQAMVESISFYRGSTSATGSLAAVDGIGGIFINLTSAFDNPTRLFAMLAALFGLGFTVWSLAEFIKSADNPQQYPVRRPIMIMFTASSLFALPAIVAALKGIVGTITGITPNSSPGLAGKGGEGLDQILVSFVSNIHGPLINLLFYVCFVSGVAFAMVGVFRLMKSAQDGPKAPWGMGTIGTFLTSAALLSISNTSGAIQQSLFKTSTLANYGVLQTATNMDPLLATRANEAIQAVFMFVQLVGWVSFIRGFFILRSYGEGDGQASMSAGFTHIIGGALAVNLSAFIDAVQDTLGLVGLTF